MGSFSSSYSYPNFCFRLPYAMRVFWRCLTLMTTASGRETSSSGETNRCGPTYGFPSFHEHCNTIWSILNGYPISCSSGSSSRTNPRASGYKVWESSSVREEPICGFFTPTCARRSRCHSMLSSEFSQSDGTSRLRVSFSTVDGTSPTVSQICVAEIFAS